MATAPVTTTTTTTTKKVEPQSKVTKTGVTTTKSAPSTTAHRVHPVHSIKRLSASITTRKSTMQSKISADFTDHRTKLTNCENTLKTGLTQIDDSKLKWEALGKNMESFSENLKGVTLTEKHQSYADVFNKSYEGAVGFHRGVSGITNQSKGVHGAGKAVTGTAAEKAEDVVVGGRNKGVEIVKEYLERLEGVKKEYPNVERLWSEMERYRRKNERMEKKKNPKEEKKLRSITKAENSRKAYHIAIDDIVERMKRLLDEYPEKCKILFETYWKKQGDFAGLLEKKTKTLQTDAANDLAKRKSLAPLPKKMTPIVPENTKSAVSKDVESKTIVRPATVAKPTKSKETDITPVQDPKTVIAPVVDTPKVSTLDKVKDAVKPKSQDAPTVKKMEEKITDAAKVGEDNTKPIKIPITKAEANGDKSPTKLTRAHHRMPSLKKIFKRSSPTTTETTTTKAAAPTAA